MLIIIFNLQIPTPVVSNATGKTLSFPTPDIDCVNDDPPSHHNTVHVMSMINKQQQVRHEHVSVRRCGLP